MRVSLAWRPEAIVFDLDGVLVDSAAVHERAFREVLEPLGISPPQYARIAGRRTDDVLRELLSSAGRDVDPDFLMELTRRKREIGRALLSQAPRLMDRCAEVLVRLSRHFALGIASSASQENLEGFLEASGSRTLFRVVLCGEDCRNGKPAPDIYLEALRRLAIPPERCLVVEDSPSGIRAGRAAGIPVVALASTIPVEDLRCEDVIAIVPRLADLLPILE